MNTLANLPLIDHAGQADCVAQAHQPDTVSISWFHNDIPHFIEAELVRLYSNTYSTLEKFRLYGPLSGVSTYVARRRGVIVTAFLFRHDGDCIKVLNEFIHVDEDELNRFSRHIFSTFRHISAICFGPVRTTSTQFSFPSHRVNFNEDIVLALPARAEDYLASLGRSTRQNINHYGHKLQRHFPTLSVTVQEKDAVDPQQLRSIVMLNRARMEAKEKNHGIDEHELARLASLVRATGMIVTVSIEGRVCAGAILSCTGDNCFLYVIAHDAAYNDFGMGTWCCYRTICECIARGAREFHFLWGREQYKYRLGGVQQDFDLLRVYRSRIDFMLDALRIAKTEMKAQIRQAKLWLLAPERQSSGVSQQAVKWMRAMRRIRHGKRQTKKDELCRREKSG